MSIHQQNNNKLPDSEYTSGHISYLQEGNKCRLLDGRRTPGYIETIDYESGMFRWRITDFEDKGNHWDLPFEQVKSYQFEKDSITVPLEQMKQIEETIKKYDQELVIVSNKEKYIKSNHEIEQHKQIAIEWLKSNSTFFQSQETIDFTSQTGPKKLQDDLINYLKTFNVEELESKTADYIVLNPNSGEWIKGISIVLAEMGIVSFYGKVPRTKDIFEGIGSKSLRKSYIIHRLAFIRAFFYLVNKTHIPLYRGMCSEIDWRESKSTFKSFTFSSVVAKSFSGFNEENNCKNAYLIKSTVDISNIFMTYLETKQMNERYKEAEALLFNTLNIVL